jgi:DNA-directed RNA polymerase specialized sigma24 family protein
MYTPREIRIGEYEKVVASAAYRFRHAAEFDDLYQEGMIAVWLCPPDADPQYIIQAVYNRLKNWVRFVKRLRHYHSVDYEEILGNEPDKQEDEEATNE